jgi:hypothetical protein
LEHPALSHNEKTLADSYRKEIDQEENVWRSLPFFAATLALLLTALFQLVTRLPPVETRLGMVGQSLLAVTGLCMFAALILLAACIAPARFRYLAREPLILDYAEDLIRTEQDRHDERRMDQFDALSALKRELAHQYAVATDHNRQVNKRRERLRAFAGLLVLASVLTTLFLVIVAFAYHITAADVTGDRYGRPCVDAPPGPEQSGAADGGTGDSAAGARSTAPANADNHKGMVGPSRSTGDR